MDDITLREYFDSRMAALEDSFDREFASIREAIKAGKELAESKYLLSQIAINKAEDALLVRINRDADDIKALQLVQANLAGKASQSDVNSLRIVSYIGLLVGIAGLLITVIKLLG